MRLLRFACTLLVALPLFAQEPPQPDRTIDAAERRAVIDGVIDRLKQAYVFPDTALAMERALRARQRRGEYDHVTSARIAHSPSAGREPGPTPARAVQFRSATG